MMLATDAGYVGVCVLLAAVWRAWWNKRGTGSGAARFFIPLFAAMAGAGLFAGLDPARGNDLSCCLASGVFRAEILLQDSGVGRAFLFGAVPAALLFTVVVMVAGALRR